MKTISKYAINCLYVIVLLSGCSLKQQYAVPEQQLPQRQLSSVEQRNEGIQNIDLEYVDVGYPGKYRTPLLIGISVDNSCATVAGSNVYMEGGNANVNLTVVEGWHVGYRCIRSPSLINWKGSLPFSMRTNDTVAVQVIVNGKPVGIVEKYPGQQSRSSAAYPLPQKRIQK